MDDKQQEFQSWLADKLQAKDMDDLKTKVQQMGEDGVRKAYDQFLSEKQQVQSNQLGGKLDYIKCLQAFKKGGMMAMKKCGCGGKMEDGGMLSKKMDKRKDVDTKEKNPGKKDYISKDFKKVQTAVGGVKEHQTGGIVTYADGPQKQNGIQVTKADGSVGMWGNNLPTVPQKNYYLNKSSVGANQVTQSQIDSLQKTFPQFNQVVGQPMVDNGNVSRFNENQSDIIRKLLVKYPVQVPQQPTQTGIPQGQTVAVNATGGIVNHIKYGERKDGNSKVWTPQGQRNDGGKKEHTAVGGNDGIGKKTVNKGNGTRKDVNVKEKNPGKKDYMSKNTKLWNTAVTKVPKGQQGAKLSGGQPAGK